MRRAISQASEVPSAPFPRPTEDKVVFSRCYSLRQEKTPSIRKTKVPPKGQVIWTTTCTLS